MPNLRERFDQGVVTSKDRGELAPGEMQSCQHGYYKPGDPTGLHKMQGRVEFGDTGSSAKVKGLALLQFDSGGTDRLLAFSGTTYYSAPITSTGQTGTFSSLKTGLSSSASRITHAHYNDRWFIGNGVDANTVVEQDGTTYDMGLPSPQEPPGATAAAATTVVRPSANSGDLTDGGQAYDGDFTTFARLTSSTPETLTGTFTGIGANTGSTRTLTVRWGLGGGQTLEGQIEGRIDGQIGDVGVGSDAGYNVTVKMELSEDLGVTYTEFFNATYTSPVSLGEASTEVTDSTNTNVMYVRVTLVYNSGTNTATARFYDVNISDGSPTAAFSTENDQGIRYGVCWFDSTNNRYSAISEVKSVTMSSGSSHNHVRLTRPSITGIPSEVTHWVVYRTTDGGSVPYTLGLLKTVPIGDATTKDQFLDADKDTIPGPIYNYLKLTDSNEGSIPFDRDTQPPPLRRIRSFRGSLVGLPANKRQMRYSVAGLPQSWPEFFFIDAFPMEEHDELVDIHEVGEYLMILAEGLVMRVGSLPRVVDGAFRADKVEPISGAPGCVGEYASVKVDVNGEPHVAWISPYGVYISNGFTFSRLTDDLEWDDFDGIDKSGWVLGHDERYDHLYMAYSSTDGGENDKFYIIHINRQHIKQTGRAKITGPHLGEFAHMATGLIAGKRRIYSAHTSNGYVYTENQGVLDESQQEGDEKRVTLSVTGRRMYADEEFSILGAYVKHSGFGVMETASIIWKCGRDWVDNERSRSGTANVAVRGKAFFDVARGGDWHEYTITHNGYATGILYEVGMQARSLGTEGTVKIA